jgi:predicted TIM-barrel fold metal-dependent hydrolase
MYSGPIIDPHHHLWDLSMNRHPWLFPADPSASPVAGLSSIAQDYLIADYLRDARRHHVVASVHIEAGWAGDPVDETRWLETLDKSSGVAARYVANAALGTPGAARAIAGQAAFARVVGVRGILSCHPDPGKSFVADPDLAYDAAWRRDVALVRDHGLHLELMMYPYQVEAVFDLALALPDLCIIINHCGSPIDRDPAGMARWRAGLRRLSGRPNIAVKISNPGAYDPSWTLESVREVALHCIDCFGTDRAMVATDWPVSRIQMSFDEIYWTMKAVAEALPSADQARLFHDTARRYYRL